MRKILQDPNNHVPSVAPDDSWGDGDVGEVAPVSTFLPPPRAQKDKKSNLTVIDSTVHRVTKPDTDFIDQQRVKTDITPRIEVNEIGGIGITRLQQLLPKPEKVVAQGGFKAKPAVDSDVLDLSGETHSWGNKKQISTKFLLISSGCVFVFIVIALVISNYVNIPSTKTSTTVLTVVNDEVLPGTDATNFLYSHEGAAISLYQVFLQARTVEEVIPLVHHGKSMKDLLIKEWKPVKFAQRWKPDENTVWSVPDTTHQPYGILEGLHEHQSRFVAHFTQSGSTLLLDWKATVAYSTASFDELSRGKGDAREIRGILTPFSSYDDTFTEIDYVSYRFNSAMGDATVWCYIKRGEQADVALQPLFKKGEITQEEPLPRQVVLHLERGPSLSQSNQWLIHRLVQPNWLTSVTPNHE